ncbi:MAG: carbon-nitrogen hydrolase [Terriglobales bacterium]
MPDSRSLRVALWQAEVATDPEANLRQAVAAAQEAAAAGAQLFCTPELFRSPYFCQAENHAHFALAEPIPGPTTEALAAVARAGAMVIVASIFERRAPGLFHNTAVVLDADGTLLGRYRKMHIPDDPRYYEKFYFTPGDLGFPCFTTRHGRVGVLVCWDQWFPEAARLTALSGADIVLYPTAIGWHPEEKAEFGAVQHQAWQTMQRAHAIANGVFVATPNRSGFEPTPGAGADQGIEFWGQSFIAAPDGQILAAADERGGQLLYADCDLAAVERARTHWPFLRDRRVDAYGGLARRWLE